jgi:hypothetical protein
VISLILRRTYNPNDNTSEVTLVLVFRYLQVSRALIEERTGKFLLYSSILPQPTEIASVVHLQFRRHKMEDLGVARPVSYGIAETTC